MQELKKTKIVATIGPSSSSKQVLRDMMKAGMNVCRLNFSHGNYDELSQIIHTIREINEQEGIYTAILADLQGPKIRIGELSDGGFELTEGDLLVFVTHDDTGDKNGVLINYENFPKDVKKGDRILLDDGKIVMEVEESNKTDRVVARCINGGFLSSKKGVNLPNTSISLPSLTPKDLKDLDFALDHDVDWIGLSFVRTARDIIELKHIINDRQKFSKIIAKIEKPEAIREFDDILKYTDGVMVARGDLGVEIPIEEVPMIQKELVRKCMAAGKPVIIATQMMESMITNLTPTRAEVTDVANAVLDGADALMLSAETSVGKHPVKVIEAMTRIIREAEKEENIYHKEYPPQFESERFISDSICFNACRLAQRVKAKAIISMTHSGYTGLKVASFRPKALNCVFTGNPRLLTQLSLVWGTHVFYYDKYVSTDHTIADIKYILKKKGYLEEKDLVINIASMPIAEKGMTNMLKLSYVD